MIDNDCRADIYNMQEDDALGKWKKLREIAKQANEQAG